MKRFLAKLDLVLLVVIAVISISLVISDLFGSSFAVDNFPKIALLLLGAFGVHLVVTNLEQESFQALTSEALDRLKEQVADLEVITFATSAEIEGELARRILEAQHSVCDLTWKNAISSGFSASARQLAHSYLDTAISDSSERLAYREVFVLNDPRRVAKLERRLEESRSGYSCRHFRNDNEIPRLQFVLVDDKEVFFFASAHDSPLCLVKGESVCQVFRSYFDAVWERARPIKDGPTIHDRELAWIRSHASKQWPAESARQG